MSARSASFMALNHFSDTVGLRELLYSPVHNGRYAAWANLSPELADAQLRFEDVSMYRAYPSSQRQIEKAIAAFTRNRTSSSQR
jgi:hypothetical protein